MLILAKGSVQAVKMYPREAGFKIVSSTFVFIIQKLLNVLLGIAYLGIFLLKIHKDTLVEEQ